MPPSRLPSKGPHFSWRGINRRRYAVRDFQLGERLNEPLRVTLPLIRGGDGGWFKLQKVKVTDREITGSAAVNLVNRPKVHIDRRTGIISINGMNGSFTGRCEKVEADEATKF